MIAGILEKYMTNREKMLRLLSLENELKNADLCDYVVNTGKDDALERILGPAQQPLAHAVRTAAMAAGASQRAQEAEDLLKPFLQSDLFAQISACKTLACEMPFSFLTPEGEVESGVMDAVLEEADGSVWVLDYKTDRVKPGEEAALLQDKYRLQLGVYRQAAQKLFAGKKVRCSAVFLRTIAAADL